jgi:hypothetical protein
LWLHEGIGVAEAVLALEAEVEKAPNQASY